MTLLEAIAGFPAEFRLALEGGFGISSAEAFYAHASDNPEGMAIALHTDQAQLNRLIRLVEGHLPAGYAERCRSAVRRPRGLNIES